jgi:Uma2 family endonuclease
MATQTAEIGTSSRLLTLDDYLDLPLDEDAGMEQEIIRGKLVIMPRPQPLHQFIVVALATTLGRYLRRRRWNQIQLVVDADLLVDEQNTYVSPDLMVFLPDAAPTLHDLMTRRQRIHLFLARPVLVVEVGSPGDEAYDKGDKRLEYQAAGIPHYWVLGSDAPSLTEFVLDTATGEYRRIHHGGTRVRPQLFAADQPSLTLDLKRLWPPLG